MTARLLLAIAAAVTVLAASGCMLSRAAGRSLASLVSTPEKVAKLDEPVTGDARLAVLWIGHASALVQIGDKVILTDPVFTSTVGQVSKRLVEPGLDPANLPPVDAVLISHMHMDHLSLGSLDMIEDKVRMLLLPRGGTAYLTDFRFDSAELRRWQAWEKDGLRITAVPVEHLGWRYGLDAAWARESFTGYVIEHDGLKVYFGGDTAYDQRLFVETAARYPGIDVALLPISPIEPREFMRRTHLDPDEAVQAFVDLGAKRMVPIHYGTFINSTDPPGEALRRLEIAKTRYKLDGREIVPLRIGERRVFVTRDGPELPPVPSPLEGAEPAPAEPTPTPPATEPEAAPGPAPEDDIPDDDRLD